MNNIKIARNIFETSINACDETNEDYTFTEIKEKLQEIIDNLGEQDFNLELCTGEVRIINSDDIDDIWTDSLIEQIKDCYEFPKVLEELPKWVTCEIDWEQTAENCKVDGLGHHFASYDGQEHSASGFYIFRTN